MLLANEITKDRPHGRVWPCAKNKKRKRFCAWFERGMDIRVKFFKTRLAAHEWLRQIAATS